MVNDITSKDNKIIKLAASLLTKKSRDENGMFIVHGHKLIKDAIKAEFLMQYLFVEDLKIDDFSEFINNISEPTQVFRIPNSLIKKISDTVTPQGIVAVFSARENENILETQGRYIALENVSNPLNVGAIIRSVNAFNLAGIIVDDVSADLFSPKVIRGSMGSVFSTKVIKYSSILDMIDDIKEKNYKIYCSAIDFSATKLSEIKFSKADIIIIGNEGSGVSKEILEKCPQKLYIEMQGTAQSLNASVAAGIICYTAKCIEK